MDMPTPRPPNAAAPRPAVAGRPAPPRPAGDERLAPALGAMVRLFCARFMPEVEPAPAQDLDA